MHFNSTQDTGGMNSIKQNSDVLPFANYENAEFKLVIWFSKVC